MTRVIGSPEGKETMRSWWLVVVLAVACSSESGGPPNSVVCETAADCENPGRPYCVQGACHECDGPSACTAELPRCSLDELACKGCVADADCARYSDTPRCGPDGACVGCVRDAQCENPRPVCDLDAQACRPCEANDECSSLICELETGTCIPEDEVLYASPTGSPTSDCSQTEPCTLDRALALATVHRSTLLMLPGAYTTPIAVSSGELKILANGARLERGITLTNAQLVVRGLEVENAAISCGMGSRLVLEDVYVHFPTGTALRAQNACDVRARRTQITGSESVHIASGGNFHGDRVKLQGNVMLADRGLVSVINAILEGTILRGGGFSDITAQLQFSTIILRDQQYLDCRYGTGGWGLRIENSIVYSRGIPQYGDVLYQPPGGMFTACATSRNLLFPQTNGGVNPLFVDISSGDYRLQATSPAVDAAMPTPTGQPDHDFAGTARPQGGGFDIGAFERIP
jgi:hypothetical protein